MSDRPMAESKEYRPPTQSQKPNMFAVSMPNLATWSALVETATKCLATDSSPSADTSHCRAEVELVIVTTVEKVLEEMMNSASAVSRSRTASCRSAPSTLETKRNTRDRSV